MKKLLRKLLLTTAVLSMASCKMDSSYSSIATEQPAEASAIKVMITEPDASGKSHLLFTGLTDDQMMRVSDFSICYVKLSECKDANLYGVITFADGNKKGFISKTALKYNAPKHLIHLVNVTSNYESLVSVMLESSQGSGDADSDKKPNDQQKIEDPLVPNPDNVDITAIEAAVIRFTNKERVDRGLKPLIVQEKIMITSRKSSEIMARNRNLQHGYTRGWMRENIARGQSSPESVVRAWIRSSGHYANIMARDTKYIGVGYHNLGRPYWTQQFN